MLYKTMKRCIERENYNSIEEMAERVSLIYANGQITEDQYIELIWMLNEKGGEK